MSHPIVRLCEQMDWESLEAEINLIYTSERGQPPLPTRLLVGLHYLKYAFDESDESVVARWVENPYWQYFWRSLERANEYPYSSTVMYLAHLGSIFSLDVSGYPQNYETDVERDISVAIISRRGTYRTSTYRPQVSNLRLASNVCFIVTNRSKHLYVH